ncbi:MAG: hypothetical protein ACI9N9_002929, partial [Enterobacterales bacterium]
MATLTCVAIVPPPDSNNAPPDYESGGFITEVAGKLLCLGRVYRQSEVKNHLIFMITTFN